MARFVPIVIVSPTVDRSKERAWQAILLPLCLPPEQRDYILHPSLMDTILADDPVRGASCRAPHRRIGGGSHCRFAVCSSGCCWPLLRAAAAGPHDVFAAICVWRKPDADIQTFFPGATSYRTDLRPVGQCAALPSSALSGPGWIRTRVDFKFYRILAGDRSVGTVLTHLGKGRYGAIEVVIALDPPAPSKACASRWCASRTASSARSRTVSSLPVRVPPVSVGERDLIGHREPLDLLQNLSHTPLGLLRS